MSLQRIDNDVKYVHAERYTRYRWQSRRIGIVIYQFCTLCSCRIKPMSGIYREIDEVCIN